MKGEEERQQVWTSFWRNSEVKGGLFVLREVFNIGFCEPMESSSSYKDPDDAQVKKKKKVKKEKRKRIATMNFFGKLSEIS